NKYILRFPQNIAVEAEVNPEPFRNGEDELPMRDFRKEFLADVHGEFEYPLLVAGRTEASDLAGEGYEHVMGAIITADSGESLTQVAAFDRIIGLNPQDRCAKIFWFLTEQVWTNGSSGSGIFCRTPSTLSISGQISSSLTKRLLSNCGAGGICPT
ncbi:MAG: hypothetical protein WCS96_08250, partial [Victivallales bacterium]